MSVVEQEVIVAPARMAAPAWPSLADQLVVALARAGIDTYFGVPGGPVEPLFNALARQQRGGVVRVIPTRSEASAAFAADGFFRATGRIAACVATTGPGSSNLLTAVMSAYADRVPMLVLTGQVSLAKQGRGALQDSSIDGFDLPKVLAECARYSTTVTHAGQLPFKLRRALQAATASPGGPIHLSLPSDVLSGAPAPGALDLPPLHARPRDAVDLDAVEDAVEALRRATNPVLYVGDDAGPHAPAITAIAATVGARIVASPAGKRWLGHHDPVYAGVVGFSGNPGAYDVIGAADLVMAFGATFDELSTNGWTVFPDVPVYAVDQHAAHSARLARAHAVIATPQHILAGLVDGAVVAPRRSPPAAARTPAREGTSDGPVHPADLMRWLSRKLPDDVVVHIDAGNSFSWSTRDLDRRRPDTYRVAMGLSTMCWSIGSSIGAAIGHRRRTICICGDGAMLMASLDLTVAVEHNLPITYIILNDSALGMVRHGQLLAGAESIGHTIAHVRFDRIAEACGAHGLRIERGAGLDHIPQAWLDDDDLGPCLIDVRIDVDAVPPMADRVRGLAVGVSS